MLPSKFNRFFDFFLPRICVSCNLNLPSDDNIICHNCLSEFESVSEDLLSTEFNRKFSKDKLVSDFYAAYIFRDQSPLETLIHKLKYEQSYQIGMFLGKEIAPKLYSKVETWSADLIIPIPLHSLRKAERGFNQAEEIAKGLSKKINIPYAYKSLKRIRFTQTQTKFTLLERKQNISNAFVVKRQKSIKDKNIILVDDVITTGATISECAKILLEAGANRVFALSVALAD